MVTIVRFPSSIVLVVALAALASPARATAQSASGAPSPDASVEQTLQNAVRQRPDSFEARHRLAGFYLQQGKVAAAIPHLRRAHQLNPSHYAVGYDLAAALIDVKRLDEARAQIQRLVTLKNSGEVQNLLGDLEERAGNQVAAAEAYQRASHMDASEENLFDWGNSLLQLRAPAPAGEVFTAAIKRHPRSARLHVGLGISLYSRGEYRDAAEAFCAAADLAPSDPRPYQFLGEMYGVSPEVGAEVAKRLGRFVETHPKHALAHFHYAMSLWKGSAEALDADGMRKVETLLRRAATLDPGLTRAFFELGVLLAQQDRHDEAIQQLRRATALEPSLSQAHYRLAQLYQRTGQKELAAKELQIFRQLTAKGGEAK
jgi:tetratricopeptide (TPR) repeat protein